ncbi:hypothetical protein ABZ439_34570 [Streptomyces sp. NPDC005840]|uniref:hypothetical protein n=1 Tax=Streptomyces sp. NPDC005840 TaxID=3157072 RepID=UPI0033F933CF
MSAAGLAAPPRAPAAEPGERLRRAARRWGPVLALYGGLKLVGFLVFLHLLDSTGDFRRKNPRFGGGAHAWDVLSSWDGWWYQQIAVHGYHPALIPIPDATGPLTLQGNSAAFFPLYPALMRLVSEVTGLGPYGAGLLVSVVASFAAALGIHRVTAGLWGHRAGLVAAGLWAVWPGSGVEWAVYSDSLYVALTAWACHAVLARNWLTAGFLTCAAGLNRPTSVTLIAAVTVAALLAVARTRRSGRPRGSGRRWGGGRLWRGDPPRCGGRFRDGGGSWDGRGARQVCRWPDGGRFPAADHAPDGVRARAGERVPDGDRVRAGVVRPLVAVGVAPLGLLGYLGWVGLRTGEPGGYFALQSGAWQHEFDFGRHTATVFTSVPVGHFDYPYAWPLADVVGVGVVLLALVLLPLLLRLRPPAVLVTHTVLTLLLVLGSQQIFGNVSRYLLPAFPLFVPVAVALSRLPTALRLALLTLAAVASGSYAGYVLFELGVP